MNRNKSSYSLVVVHNLIPKCYQWLSSNYRIHVRSWIHTSGYYLRVYPDGTRPNLQPSSSIGMQYTTKKTEKHIPRALSRARDMFFGGWRNTIPMV